MLIQDSSSEIVVQRQLKTYEIPFLIPLFLKNELIF